MGFALGISGSQLMSFARFADRAAHIGPLTERIIVDWVRSARQPAAQITLARRVEIIRPFAKHCAQIDIESVIPARDMFGKAHRRLVPHIYTPDEICNLLAAASHLSPQDGLRPATYETLFGLIASTGLRISEALNLRSDDVDLVQGVMTVRQTKFRKTRLVPTHPTVTESLRKYAAVRKQNSPLSHQNWFFCSPAGTRLAKRTVHSVFEGLREQLQWKPRGGHPGPRIHDLRHTFVCQRVKLWQTQGADIDHAMLALSTYLGHAKVTDTYWYLTGVPGLLAVAANRFERFANDATEGSHV
jgi:integrase